MALLPGMMSPRSIVESPGWNNVHVRVVTTSSVSGRIGSRCCSPSLWFAASPMMRHIMPSSGNDVASTGKVTVPVSPFLTFTFMLSTTSSFSVLALSNDILTVALMSLSERFATVALMFALSPWRRKRGMRGCTMSCFCATASSVSIPTLMFLSWASPMNFHVVTLSGKVKRRFTFPLPSVMS